MSVWGELYAVWLRPKNTFKRGMLTYRASSGQLFEASKDSVPQTIELISNKSNVAELKSLGTEQFEIVEVSPMQGDLDGDLMVLDKQIEELLGSKFDIDTDMEAFEELTAKADLYVGMLREKANDIEAKVKKVSNAIVKKGLQ